ncbi:hypothetical protein HQ496_10185, partial [bacterium]|nr:hypothetical protein [bacterium]
FNVDRGVNQLSEVLQSETQTFDGQVVLAVGDTHVFRVDKPLYAEGTLVPNFTRLEVFGEPTVGWVSVRVDIDTEQVFTFSQKIVSGN